MIYVIVLLRLLQVIILHQQHFTCFLALVHDLHYTALKIWLNFNFHLLIHHSLKLTGWLVVGNALSLKQSFSCVSIKFQYIIKFFTRWVRRVKKKLVIFHGTGVNYTMDDEVRSPIACSCMSYMQLDYSCKTLNVLQKW